MAAARVVQEISRKRRAPVLKDSSQCPLASCVATCSSSVRASPTPSTAVTDACQRRVERPIERTVHVDDMSAKTLGLRRQLGLHVAGCLLQAIRELTFDETPQELVGIVVEIREVQSVLIEKLRGSGVGDGRAEAGMNERRLRAERRIHESEL